MPNLKLNLKHLRYFWAVANQGSIARAAENLFVTPQTISGQLRELEEQIGAKLFERDGRNLALTDTGRMVASYADEIFRLAFELQDAIAGDGPESTITLKVGIAMAVPKLLSYQVLAPVLDMPDTVRLRCHQAPLPDLLADLSVHKLDMVLADGPITTATNVRAYNHLLGESGTSFFAVPKLAASLVRDFPSSLNGQPMLLPGKTHAVRPDLDAWFERQGILPRVVAEFDDRALMKAFGEGGAGIFMAPSTVEQEVQEKYAVALIGRTNAVNERFYLISAERRIKHPAIAVITEVARAGLFSRMAPDTDPASQALAIGIPGSRSHH